MPRTDNDELTIEIELWLAGACRALVGEGAHLRGIASRVDPTTGIVVADRDTFRALGYLRHFPALAATCRRIARAGYLEHLGADRWRIRYPSEREQP
jgi:hypothetical protein